jgi:PAS domain S-box-containing protein
MNEQQILREHTDQLRNFLDGVKRREPSSAQKEEFAARALLEIEATVEELNVAEEELRVQQEELESTQAALHAERERYRRLFDEAPDPYFETDDSGVIRTANRAASALFGLRADRLTGKPLLLYIAKDDHRHYFARMDELRTGGVQSPLTFDLTIATRAGDVHYMQARVDARAGQKRLRWLLRDFTDMRRAEEAERQVRLEQAMRSASEIG